MKSDHVQLILYCPACGQHWLLAAVLNARAQCVKCDQWLVRCPNSRACTQAHMHGVADMNSAVRVERKTG